MDLDTSNTDEYFVTALQIFDCCGADNAGTLSVDALMDKCAPLDKSIKCEYSHLRGLLDPEKSNPNISVKELAMALNKFSESQKKFDLDESFNVAWNLSGQAPQDSDSGISADAGHQLQEELQSALREKAHQAFQLRSQLEFNERQHEEAVQALTAERDAAKALNNILREENATLSHVRQDYCETSERLCESESALEEARRELEMLKRRARTRVDQIAELESDKLTLQELLNQSKAECHRINEMYAARQSALLVQNEALREECAGLNSRAQELHELMQQCVKEKMLLEIELKDLLNKSNMTHHRLDRSIDVSYTEDQMLSALDSLNADTRFEQDDCFLSDQESFFMKSIIEDHGRTTNISLFEEIRLSICKSKHDTLDFDDTQEDEKKCEQENNANNNSNIACDDCRVKCTECEKRIQDITQADTDLKRAHKTIAEMQSELDKCENNLAVLQKLHEEGNDRNNILQSVIDKINAKIAGLQEACDSQKRSLDNLLCEASCAQCQTDNDVASVGTQADAGAACVECARRVADPPATARSWRRYLWDAIKSLFSMMAGVFLLSALLVLYNVSSYHYVSRRCVRGRAAVPWRWLSVADVIDNLFRIEYVGEVPM